LKTWQAYARMTAAASVLLLSLPLVLPATSQPKAAEDCPFAGTRPPLDEILTRPPTERPPLCKADLTGAILIRANLTGPTSPGPTSPGPASSLRTSPGPTSSGPTSAGPTSPLPTFTPRSLSPIPDP
jgi:hypothetical protein